MYIYEAICTRVVDGDTIDAKIDLGFRMTRLERLRLLSIDTPERGQENFKEATEFLYDLLFHPVDEDLMRLTVTHPNIPRFSRSLIIESEKGDSFGRWLATIWLAEDYGDVEAISINQMMLVSELAKPYEK